MQKNNTKSKRAILSVTNDLLSDQRMHKVCTSLIKINYQPLLVGRLIKGSKKLNKRDYDTKRFRMLFTKSWLFYAAFNFRLFLFLLFSKADVLVANDLDSLLANYLAYKIKRFFGNKHLKLVYDSHELFTELPELNGRKVVKKTWILIEKWILPKIKNAYTVCGSIADFYEEKYAVSMQVISNMPLRTTTNSANEELHFSLPANKKIILYQGALNIGRGIEPIIGIMDRIDDAVFVIAGIGDIENTAKHMVKEKQLEDKVIFTGRLPFEQLLTLTKQADIGLVLQEDISLSYRFVLPNRLFDFIKAKVPILASDLPEIKKIVGKEKIGLMVNGFEPDILIEKIKLLLNNAEVIKGIKQNLESCADRYCWEVQEEELFGVYRNLK